MATPLKILFADDDLKYSNVFLKKKGMMWLIPETG